jgi:uncharacterized protein YbbC (DUF1343 family)
MPFAFMAVVSRDSLVRKLLLLLAPFLVLAGCSTPPTPAPPVVVAPVVPPPIPAQPEHVMLGIDVLEAEDFAALKGKRIGLLTHPAGVNASGFSTIDVLRTAPGVTLVTLFGAEHGVDSEFNAGAIYPDYVDQRTGLPVRSLYTGKTHEPTAAQLKDIDALVVDLQDIGTRSYTFVSAMHDAVEGCLKNGKEVIVLDRPNPLGGLKVDGPIVDPTLVSYVGALRVPYVHGLTIGELARMTERDAIARGVVRPGGRLTVVPMRGWMRSMRWPDTGLIWVPTSGAMEDFAAVEGYPMVGLGCEPPSDFRTGFRGPGERHWFRVISHRTAKPELVEKQLRALNLHGIQFRRINVPNAKTGEPTTALYIEIADYNEWQPTELNFWLMKLACKLASRNPYAATNVDNKSLFARLVGSEAFIKDLRAKGQNIDIEAWLRTWREQAKLFQEQSKAFWLYQ